MYNVAKTTTFWQHYEADSRDFINNPKHLEILNQVHVLQAMK